jgi:hypothetical protein
VGAACAYWLRRNVRAFGRHQRRRVVELEIILDDDRVAVIVGELQVPAVAGVVRPHDEAGGAGHEDFAGMRGYYMRIRLGRLRHVRAVRRVA